ncbi:MAG: NADH-quinone oxidoreductase subunit C [Candidatus Thermoplasmatota archaeon]|nr:NADH-quinone oxidoreductase subunit C [Candidatus Thermoplasmatota archaeon]
MNPEEIVEKFKSKFGAGVLDAKVQTKSGGVSKTQYHFVWMTLERPLLKDAVRFLASEWQPHLSVISGVDLGNILELTYHFTVGWGVRLGEIPVSIRIDLPKDDLTVPTITDIIPGALITEREKQEMLGIKVIGIPDARRLFVPETFPEGVYPWRKDATGVQPEHVKKLWEVGRLKLTPTGQGVAVNVEKAAAPSAPAKKENAGAN